MGALDNTATASLQLEKVRSRLPLLFERDNKNAFFPKIEKKEVEVISKRDMRVPFQMAPGGYFGFYNPDGGGLGRGSGPVFKHALVNTVNLRYAVEWTQLADWATNGGRKAIAQGVKKTVADAMAEFRKCVDSLSMTDGTGVLGTVSAVSSSTSGGDTLWTITLNTDGFGAKLIRPGQKVSNYNSTASALSDVNHTPAVALNTAANGKAGEVAFYDPASKIIKIWYKTQAATAITAGTKVVVEGLTGDLRTDQVANAIPVSLQGVPYHHSDASTGYWQGLDRSLYPQIRSNRVNAGGGLALPFPRLALNKIGDRLGADAMDKSFSAFCHPCQAQAYEEMGQLVSIINKSAKDEGLDLYFSDSMQMAGAPLVKNFSWDRKRIDFTSLKSWGRAELKPIDTYEVQGRTIFEGRDTDGSVATYQMSYIVGSFQLFNENPAEAAFIDGLTVPTGY